MESRYENKIDELVSLMKSQQDAYSKKFAEQSALIEQMTKKLAGSDKPTKQILVEDTKVSVTPFEDLTADEKVQTAKKWIARMWETDSNPVLTKVNDKSITVQYDVKKVRYQKNYKAYVHKESGEIYFGNFGYVKPTKVGSLVE